MIQYPALPDAGFARLFRRRLHSWFRAAQRDLPWRHDRDPYHIWVSEVMLQQTQAVTVAPYFTRFIKEFPTIESLARATESRVLKAWEGLGYYRRARHLYRAAQQIFQDYNGHIPDDAQQFLSLPGVGRYIAGAVLSQAFDTRLPIIEANSLRVLCRLMGCAKDPRKGRPNKWLWQTAVALLPRKNIGDHNQALMELGALVCTARQPGCGACPVRNQCYAYANGLQDAIPVRAINPPVTVVDEVALIVRREQKVLILQCSAGGRWGGFWEFPHGPRKSRESGRIAARRILRETTGLQISGAMQFGELSHSITRYRIHMECYLGSAQFGRVTPRQHDQFRWVRFEQLSDTPMSSPQRRLVAMAHKNMKK